MNKKRKPTLYLLEIQLQGAVLPVWRIIEVKPTISMHELHATIQVAMGWQGGHLYEFTRGKEHYIDYVTNEPYAEGVFLDSRLFKLAQVLQTPGDQIAYLYDYGDNWQHTIILKGFATKSQDFVNETPSLLAGAMNCPPEDIGGIGAYNELVNWHLNNIKSLNHEMIAAYKNFDVFNWYFIGRILFRRTVNRLLKDMDKD
jgi:hypothetical protein